MQLHVEQNQAASDDLSGEGEARRAGWLLAAFISQAKKKIPSYGLEVRASHWL
jgi:hypothetical protein